MALQTRDGKFNYVNLALNAEESAFWWRDYNELMRLYESGFVRRPYFFGYNNRPEILVTLRRRLADYKRKINEKATRIIDNIDQLRQGNITAVRQLTRDQYKFTTADFQALQRIMNRGRWLLAVKIAGGDVRYLTITNRGWPTIKYMLQNYFEVVQDEEENIGSDNIAELLLEDIEEMEFQPVARPARILPMTKRDNKNGRFFAFQNLSNIDLTRYQILSNETQTDLIKEHCVIYALRLLGVPKGQLDAIMSMFSVGAHFPKKHLYRVAEILGKTINLVILTEEKIRTTKYGNYEESFDLALYEDHYFIYEPTPFTVFSAKNYRKIADEDDNENIVKIRKDKKTKCFNRNPNAPRINSLQLVDCLRDQGYFDYADFVSQLDNSANLKQSDEVDLSNIDNEQELFEYSPKAQIPRAVFFADTETFVTDGNHSPLLMGIMKETDNWPYLCTTEIVDGKNSGSCVLYCLDYAIKKCDKKAIVIYFHNLKYDFNVIKEYVHVLENGICEKGGSLYSVRIMYKKKEILLVDSYKMANFRLADFQRSFALPADLNKREAIGYTYYTIDNYDKRASVPEYLEHVKPSQHDIFMEEMKKNPKSDYDEATNTFDPIEYYRYYLKYDVKVLCAGMLKMKDALLTITGLNMYNYLTISAISDDYVKKNGAYDGVYKMYFNLRRFCSQAVTGGRVHVQEKYKKRIITKRISDYDAVSLYPSAMFRLSAERGIAKGKAKVLETLDYEQIKQFSYAIMRVRINAITKYQQMPIVHKREDGKIDYVNESEPFETFIDIYQLADYIKYQGVQFEILGGVYWNEGFNKKIGALNKKLFDARIKYKEDENESLQLCCKLMMNSIYGRSILKQTKECVQVVSEEEKDNVIWSKFSTIKKFEKLNSRQYKVYLDKLDDSANFCHVGVSILSYSKRIVNEVLDVANDHKIPIYYTDTDSLHVRKSGLKTLKQEYRKIHKRDLDGEGLGQFNSDFKLAGCKNVYAYKSCFIGKKVYIDMLMGTDKKDKEIKRTGTHIRIKGITKAGIDHKIDSYDGDAFKIFENLANGVEEKFILNPSGSVLFEYSSAGVCTKLEEFSRTL